MSHSLFSPSSAHRWINCPGSMAFSQNQEEGESSGFADNGTASHTLAAWCLSQNKDCEAFRGKVLKINGVGYVVDDDRIHYTQMYVDDVRRRTLGGHLLVEQWVDLAEWLGEGQGGTSDAIIIHPAQQLLIVEDLKYGIGEKVRAEANEQGMLYALGALSLARLICDDIRTVRIVIHQPRIAEPDEWDCSVEELLAFAERARAAASEAGHAMLLDPGSPDLNLYLAPGKKTCRWCRAKAACPKLESVVAEEVRADFDVIAAEPPVVPTGTEQLGRAMTAVPLVEDWCRAVKAEVWRLAMKGEGPVGPDGQPYKIIQGKDGKREWKDEKLAEEALLGQLPEDKVYAPREIVTAPVAGKILDKKKTKALWEEIFKPLIRKAPGRPKLVLGSEEGEPYTGNANAEEFEDEIGIAE